MNIDPAWQKGYTGKGVVVSILDDGIQRNHPDLVQNYVSISGDFVFFASITDVDSISDLTMICVSICKDETLVALGI